VQYLARIRTKCPPNTPEWLLDYYEAFSLYVLGKFGQEQSIAPQIIALLKFRTLPGLRKSRHNFTPRMELDGTWEVGPETSLQTVAWLLSALSVEEG